VIHHQCLSSDKLPQLYSETLIIDRKIRFRVGSKSCVALKHLREQFTTVLALKMRRILLTETQERWYSLALMVLGRMPLDEAPLHGNPPLLINQG
jgi:ATP-dependent RNA helicase DHX29